MNYIQYVFAERNANIDIRTYDASTFWRMIWPYIDTFPKFLKEDREKFDFYYCKFYVAFKEVADTSRPVAICAVTTNFAHPNPSSHSSKNVGWIWIAASTRGSKYHVRGAFPKLFAHVLSTYGILHGRYLDKNAKRFWNHFADKYGYKLDNVMWPWGAEGLIIRRK